MISKKKLAKIKREKEIEKQRSDKEYKSALSKKLGPTIYQTHKKTAPILESKDTTRSWDSHRTKYPSAPDKPIKQENNIVYEGDMLEREIQAKKDQEVLKARIAPAYNKGGLQLITDGMQEDIVFSRKLGVKKV